MRETTPESLLADGRHPFRMSHAVIVLVLLTFSSCRVPDAPVIKDKSQGIIYDTAMENELRSGKAHALVQAAYADYVDTLSEPVAITGWSPYRCRWEIFVGTNRGL